MANEQARPPRSSPFHIRIGYALSPTFLLSLGRSPGVFDSALLSVKGSACAFPELNSFPAGAHFETRHFHHHTRHPFKQPRFQSKDNRFSWGCLHHQEPQKGLQIQGQQDSSSAAIPPSTDALTQISTEKLSKRRNPHICTKKNFGPQAHKATPASLPVCEVYNRTRILPPKPRVTVRALVSPTPQPLSQNPPRNVRRGCCGSAKRCSFVCVELRGGVLAGEL